MSCFCFIFVWISLFINLIQPVCWKDVLCSNIFKFYLTRIKFGFFCEFSCRLKISVVWETKSIQFFGFVCEFCSIKYCYFVLYFIRMLYNLVFFVLKCEKLSKIQYNLGVVDWILFEENPIFSCRWKKSVVWETNNILKINLCVEFYFGG